MNWLDRSLNIGPYLHLCLHEDEFIECLDHINFPKSGRSDFLNPNADATTHQFRHDGKMYSLVCLGNTEGRDITIVYGLLVHEATHVFQYACTEMGETKPGEEIEAYAIQWISQQLMWAYNCKNRPVDDESKQPLMPPDYT